MSSLEIQTIANSPAWQILRCPRHQLYLFVLISLLKAEGVEVDESSFIPLSSNEIVSNRVGANKRARREVRAWTDQLFGKEAEQVSAESKDAAAEEDLANEVDAEEAVAEKSAADTLAAEEVVSDDDAPERLAGETTLVVASEAIAEKLQEVADVLEDVVAAVEQSAVDLQELHSAGEPAVPEEVSASVSVAPEVAAPGAFVEEVAEAKTVEEVAAEEVAVEESVAEEVALQEVADEDPTVEGEAVKEMTLQEVSAAEAGDEEVAVEEPSVGEVVVQDGDEEVVVEKGDAKENIFEEVAVEEVAVEGVAAEEVASKEVTGKEVAVEEVAVNEGIAVEEVADEEVKAEEIPVVELCEEVSVAETAEDLPTTEFIDDITEKEDIPIDSEVPCQRVEEVNEEPPVERVCDSEAENETHAKEIFSATEISEKEKLIKETSAEQIMAMKQATEESTTPALA